VSDKKPAIESSDELKAQTSTEISSKKTGTVETQNDGLSSKTPKEEGV
jgi:hypothetical protein